MGRATSRAFRGGCAVLLAASLGLSADPPDRASPLPLPAVVRVSASRLPVAFEPNVGQAPEGVAFVVHRGSAVFLISSSRVVGLVPRGAEPERRLELEVIGAAQVEGEGEQRLPGLAHYFLGGDASKWRRDIPTFGRVVFRDVYPGIHLAWHGEKGELEYDFIVEPGVDPGRIRVASVGEEPVSFVPPTLYQDEDDGARRPVPGRWSEAGEGAMAFAVGPYDPQRRLVIDPPLAWSTFLGGNGVDSGRAIVADANGSVYLVGDTASTNFPLQGPVQAVKGAFMDVFVTKLNWSGTAVIFSTFLGGDGLDSGNGLAVDALGSVRVVGGTNSTNFPTAAALQSSRRGPGDAFVVRLNDLGNSLVFSTYLGGAGQDEANDVALDAAGAAHAVGVSTSADFPALDPLQLDYGGGSSDAFVTKLSAAGALQRSSPLGGSGQDSAAGIALDTNGKAWVAGETSSTDFPMLNPFQASPGGGFEAFLVAVAPAGTLAFSSYLGGSGADTATDVALDGSGRPYVLGQTASTDFPVLNPLQASYGGGLYDAFVAKFDGVSRAWSTWLGGSDQELAGAIAVDGAGRAWVVGATASTDFPTALPAQAASGGSYDAFVAALSPTGGALSFSTYLGGSALEIGAGVSVTATGYAYVTGSSSSLNFPTTAGVLQPARDVTDDGFVSAFLQLGPADAGSPGDGGSSDAGSPGDGGSGDAGSPGDGGSTDGGGGGSAAPQILREASPTGAFHRPWVYGDAGVVRATGSAPIRFERCGGPAELSIDDGTGLLTWTPVRVGLTALCVRAVNDAGADEYPFEVDVLPQTVFLETRGCGCGAARSSLAPGLLVLLLLRVRRRRLPAGKHPLERLDARRLCEVAVESGNACPGHVVGHRVARQGDQPQ